MFSQPASGSGYTMLYKFSGGKDGGAPYSGVVGDASGNLYGTTFNGGSSTGCSGNAGCGVVFKLAADGTESVLWTFSGNSDGGGPGSIIRNGKGYIYGVTGWGGSGPYCTYGCGAIFKLSPKGSLTTLYAFTGDTDGTGPTGIVMDSSGNFFGSTRAGGNSDCEGYGCGTVFKLSANGVETVLYRFLDGADGAGPGPVIMDGSGNLYGQAGGGSGACSGGDCGVVFKVTPGGNQTVLYTFKGGSDGNAPIGGLILDEAGNLYGVTEFGGGTGCDLLGCGTVFKLGADGVEKVLYAFQGGNDGGFPYAGLVEDSKGNLYGTTEMEGSAGGGTIFKISAAGKFSLLYSFDFKLNEGARPIAPMLLKDGNLYGTTSEAGRRQCAKRSGSCGTVFMITK